MGETTTPSTAQSQSRQEDSSLDGTQSSSFDSQVKTADPSVVEAQSAITDRPKLSKYGAPILYGWRLNVVLGVGFTGFFLSLLDSTIVAVSLPSIANHFNDFERSTWVINAYLISYMAFAIIVARLSDIVGRKTIQVTAFVIFIAFSIACAVSQSMIQLILFRALQGIGGCGMFSMCLVVAMTMQPPEKKSMTSAYLGVTTVCSGIFGPVLGGAITLKKDSTTWPWIFWINVPIGSIALILLFIAWPAEKVKKKFTWAAFASVDFLGCLLLLAASALLIFSLEEGGTYVYSWNSPLVIACLTVSGVCFILFGAWQYFLTKHPNMPTKVVFPITLMGNRVILAQMAATMLSGFTYYLAVVNIPQRLQIVSGSSPINAGVQMLPMLAFSAVGSISGGLISRKKNYTAPTLVVAAAFQLLGYGLMTTLGNGRKFPDKFYGFEIFLGLGFGLSISTATKMMEVHVETKWIAVTQGALAQMRTLGGCIGLAVAVIIFNGGIRSSSTLQAALTPAQASSLLKSPLLIETFSPQQQQLVAAVFADSFTQQMLVATYIAAGTFVAGLCTLQRHPPPAIRAVDPEPPEETTAPASNSEK